ncbi:MAG: ComF family protein [Candidatus Neomarinimicrobiota bacterium]
MGHLPNPLELLFPSLCVLCSAPLDGERSVCRHCLESLSPTGLGQWQEGVLVNAELDNVWCAFRYDEAMETLIHLLKYQGHRRIGYRLSEAVFRLMEGEIPWGNFDVLVPIPLHRTRLRERGYNQSGVLARGLGDWSGLPMEDRLVVRHRWTRSQTGLSLEERRENVSGSFRTSRAGDGRNVLLVDDVLTSGATASACALALRAGGYGEVAVLAVATPLKGE